MTMIVPAYAEYLFVFIRVLLMLAVAVTGLLILRRRSKAEKAYLLIAALLLVWCSFVWALIRFGVYQAVMLPLFIFIPVIIAFVLCRTSAAKVFIDEIPQAALVGIQVFRVIGGSFLLLWADGLMPGLFALPVAIGDILIGVSALAIILMMRSAVVATGVIIAWNILGLADHLMALFLGLTSSPGPLQQFSFDLPNALTGYYPVAMIPAFIIPLSFILHGLSLWKLRRFRDRPIAS